MGTVYGLRYDKSYYINKLKEKYGDRFIYDKVEFNSLKDNITLICSEHKIEFQIQFKSCFKSEGVNCPLCKRKKISETKLKNYSGLSNEQFIEKANKVHNNKYDYSKVDMLNRNKDGKVCIICPIHGEFWQKPSQHLFGKGCKECGTNKLNTETFIKKAKKIHGDDFSYEKTIYKSIFDYVTVKCNRCGTEYEVIAHNHLKGRGCRFCKHSNLELEIEKFLKDNNIEFEYQKFFKWLGRKSLDFYLPEYNIAIECQGIQHFSFKESSKIFTEKKMLRTKESDKCKKKICEENGITILYYSNLGIEYPYYVFEDKEKLLEEIKKY